VEKNAPKEESPAPPAPLVAKEAPPPTPQAPEVKPVQSQKALPLAEDFLSFVNASRSPFHAVDSAKKLLDKGGFVELHEKERWALKNGGRYYYTRNQSALIAFSVGSKFVAGNGFSIIGAHTDSPCLKVKPISNTGGSGFLQVGVSTYGGGLWHTWFDRDLTLAGRVIINSPDHKASESRLVYINRPILKIPNLAIHLDRSVNDGFKFNAENHLKPLLETSVRAQFETKSDAPHNNSLLNLLSSTLGVEVSQISNFELCLCDFQDSCLGGINQEFIFSPRLDNLLHCFTGIRALIDSLEDGSIEKDESVRMVTLFDNEEVGSRSAYGAMSPMLVEAIERINCSLFGKVSLEETWISKRKSFFVSTDMAHAVHPNYPEKHEANHRPAMHKGPVIKINLETRYATNSESEFLLEMIAKNNKIPIQKFCVRNDMGCGTTIGPIVSGDSGIRTVDLGNPQLSMHSIREMCGVDDVLYCVDLLKAFYRDFPELDKQLKVD